MKKQFHRIQLPDGTWKTACAVCGQRDRENQHRGTRQEVIQWWHDHKVNQSHRARVRLEELFDSVWNHTATPEEQAEWLALQEVSKS